MNKKIIHLLLLTVLLYGCAVYHLDFQDKTDNYYPPKNSIDEVQYLVDVTQDHEVIGQVIANTERRWKGAEEVIRKLKKSAVVLGADAITNLESDATGTWKRLPAQKLIGNGYIRANFRAQVVAFK